MPPFKFRLQQVLEYRTQLEDQAKMVFAAAKDAHERQRLEVVRIQTELEEAFARRAAANKANRDEAWLLENYRKGLAEDLEIAQQHLHHLALQLEDARQKLVQAMQDRSLLDKLKEKQYARHRKEELAREQQFNDEIVTLRPRTAPF